MSFKLLVRKLLMDNDRYLSEKKLKEHCKVLGISYVSAIKYLGKYHYIARVLRGFFYVPTIGERKLKTRGPNLHEAIARAMEYKKVKNWYWGLETAIKMNAITHEYFTIDYVVSDTIFRSKPIEIFGRRVKFVKLNKKLFGFGIKAGDVPYSDLEKTILDLIHIKKYAGKSNKAIRDYLIEWADEANRNRMKKYSRHYSKPVREALAELK